MIESTTTMNDNTTTDIATIVLAYNQAKAKHEPIKAMLANLESLPARSKGKKELVAQANAISDESLSAISVLQDKIRNIAIDNLRNAIAQRFFDSIGDITDASTFFVYESMKRNDNFCPSKQITIGFDHHLVIECSSYDGIVPSSIRLLHATTKETLVTITGNYQKADNDDLTPMEWTTRLSVGNMNDGDMTILMIAMQDAKRLMAELNNAKIPRIGWSDIYHSMNALIEANTNS